MDLRAFAPTVIVPVCAGAMLYFLSGPTGDAATARAAGVAGHDFVGVETCRTCHEEQYQIWLQGPHAKALAVLSENEKKDMRCLQCHTMIPTDLALDYQGIQCETCHGPGRYYSPEHVMRDSDLRSRLLFREPTESTCKSCHTEDSPALEPFSYEKMLERMKHWD